ncbi:hypothetical protein M1771_02800 [Spiroplasma citri]|uniref:Lipoprotein n=1 Tax=Spiroplasma citri TaxID=2133 RepID=A0AAX3T077_SPICI|nr:hypothetical protein [Spiroplasma citri]WFG96959.1 hypothetical protein M0C40_02805 [Spiroplasma citri]WFH00858.1 hypothetical protein M1771_02800 [Spiroplasma citri]
MKKVLWILLCSIPMQLTIYTFGCKGFNYGSNPPNLKPIEPPEEAKDINYYLQLKEKNQKLFEKAKKEIDELNSSESIQEICGSSRMCSELQEIIDANMVEMYEYQAIVYDCDYQILFLEIDGDFSDKKIRENAIAIIKNENDILKKQLKLMTTSSDPYREDEINKVKDLIKTCEEILEKLNKENENKI